MDENTNVTGGAESGAESATDTGNVQGQETQNTGENTPKTYTAEELQAETDRRVTEAVKTANAKSEEAFKKQLETARADWEKESKMTAAEREKAAAEKAKAEFEKEKAAFEREKLVSRAGTQLIKNGLPEEIAELITASGATEETISESITVLKTAFDKAVELAVNEKLKGTPPKTGGGGNQESDPFLSGFGI
ncbi:MAG: DUF4355 domain-containing protein [Clostridia bacterium]|nr:DUF4355 domain-containing protein [Clostridia bacterium]